MKQYNRSDGNVLTIPENLSEVTFREYMPFFEKYSDFERRVKKFYKLENNQWADIADLFIDFKEDIIWQVKYFTKCDDIENAEYETVKILYTQLLINLFPKAETISEFTYKEKIYKIPDSVKSIANIIFPMAEATFGQVTEAMQLERLEKEMAGGAWQSIPKQMAIITLPRAENNAELFQRAKDFTDLPMDICYNFAFFLMTQKLLYYGNSLSCLKKIPKASQTKIKNN